MTRRHRLQIAAGRAWDSLAGIGGGELSHHATPERVFSTVYPVILLRGSNGQLE
jgi:hypothetical protein